MRFETILARRYISSQKRHSALTICSIAIAVALMTMMFTCYGTYIKCLRAAYYDSAPYHYRFMQVDEKQSEVLKALEQVDSYNITKNNDGTYQVDLLFKKGSIGELLAFDQELARKLDIPWENYYSELDYNNNLMVYDMISDNARFIQLQLFSIFFVFVICLALMLRLIIDTAFEISSKERERQFGVLQSIGATPKHIVRIITVEGLLLSVIGLPIGILLGIGVAYAAFRAILSSGVADAFFTSDKAEQLVKFHISPLMLLVSAIVGLAWVLFSAYGTGMRIIKMSPVEAISNRSSKVKKVRRHTLAGLLFGWTGKLASRNARRQKKRFIITILSLTLSITLFASLGAVFTTIIEFEEASLKMYGGDFDFEVNLSYSPTEPLGYREPLGKIENSGYFKELEMTIGKMVTVQADGKDKLLSVVYMSRYSYDNFFGGKPPVPYDELVGTKNYVYASSDKIPDSISSLTGIVIHYDITDEIKNSVASASEPDAPDTHDDPDDHTHDSYLTIMREIKNNFPDAKTTPEHTFSISAVGKKKEPDIPQLFAYEEDEREEEYLYLLATLEQYEAGEYEIYGNLSAPEIVDLKLDSDDKYSAALRFIENTDGMELFWNNYIEAKKLRTTTSAIRIGAAFLTAIIALSAIVNIINIISTGIINRRSELASMQCVGMTEGQQRGMVIVEALQYTLISAISAVIICLLIMYDTGAFLVGVQLMEIDQISSLIRFSEVLWRIGLFTVIALIVSILAALFPLQSMKKTSLVERIRSVE